MNERILELMRQSMVEHQFDLRFSPEKFAELIVKEILRITGAPPSMVETAKKHFGVE